MGYLLATYYRKMKRGLRTQLQADLMEITRKAKFAKKQAEECLKGLEYQAKVAKNDAQVMVNARIAEIANQLYANAGIDPNAIDYNNLSDDQKRDLVQIQQEVSSRTQQIMQQVTAYNSQVDIWLENMKHNQYDPLKQEDELLAQQADDKKSDLEMADKEYEAAQKLEQAELKNVVPQWGG